MRVLCIGGRAAGQHVDLSLNALNEGRNIMVQEEPKGPLRPESADVDATVTVRAFPYKLRHLRTPSGELWFAVADNNSMVWALLRLTETYEKAKRA